MKDVDVMVFGAACCGKTTLARMLAERFHYPVFHNDALRGFFRGVFSIPPSDESALESDAYASFVCRFLRGNKELDGFDTRYIFEGSVSVQHARRFFRPEKNIMYFLGMTEPTVEEICGALRADGAAAEGAAPLPEPELRQRASAILSASANDKKLCARYGIPFIETGGDREAALASLAGEIAARVERIDREDANRT